MATTINNINNINEIFDNSAYIYNLVSLIENKNIKDLSKIITELNINTK